MKSLYYSLLTAIAVPISLLGCGREEPKSTGMPVPVAKNESAVKGGIDVCTKITDEDASKILGVAASRNPQGDRATPEMRFCSWDSTGAGLPSTLNVRVTTFGDAGAAKRADEIADETFAKMQEDAKKQGSKTTEITIEKIDGLGDRAHLKRGGMHSVAHVVVLRGPISYDFHVVSLNEKRGNANELLSVVKRVLS